MEEDAPKPFLPQLDEHDRSAVIAILIRTVRLQDEMAKDQALVKEANARIANGYETREKAMDALSLFGFKRPENGNIWHAVRATIGDETYDQAVAIARGQFPTLLSQMGDSPSQRVEETHANHDKQASDVPIRIVILQYLRGRGAHGAKVAEVRRHLEDAHHLRVHEKTPGMTLYRLFKEGLVERTGRTWYAKEIIENNENEASAAGAEDASETRLAAQ